VIVSGRKVIDGCKIVPRYQYWLNQLTITWWETRYKGKNPTWAELMAHGGK